MPPVSRRFRQRRRRALDEGVEARALDRDDQTRIRAELTGAEGQRSRERSPDFRAPVQQCVWIEDYGVDAAHFGVDGYQLLPLRRDLHQRGAAAARAGETNCAYPVVGDQGLADLEACVEQKRESS
jgi:hypothetical protein